MHKLKCAAIRLPILHVAKSMLAGLNRPVIFDRIYFNTFSDHRSGQDIFLAEERLKSLQGLFVITKSGIILVNLKVLGKEALEFIEVPGIECLKKDAVLNYYGVIQIFICREMRLTASSYLRVASRAEQEKKG